MTKFSDGFIKEVKQHWEDNKGKVLGKKVGGIHRKVTSEKKFGIQDVGTKNLFPRYWYQYSGTES